MSNIELSLRYFEKYNKATCQTTHIVGFHLCKMDTQHSVCAYAYVFERTETYLEVNLLYFITVI